MRCCGRRVPAKHTHTHIYHKIQQIATEHCYIWYAVRPQYQYTILN